MTNNQRLICDCSAKKVRLSLVCLALSACNGDMSDLDQRIADIKAIPKEGIAPLPAVKIIEPFSFDPADGSRNPFLPVEREKASDSDQELDNGVKPDPTRVKEELESYPFENLRMVGTVKDLKNSILWGLVLATNGTLYKVKVGNYMGLNDGKINEVSEKEIKVMEIIPDKSSDKDKARWKELPNSLKLVATQ